MLKPAIALTLALAAPGALGQVYPSKPVHMIIPFAPGGASDFVGRIVQPKLAELLGEQIVIENRAGAAGNIGMEAAAKAAPDGYTIYLGNIGTIAINPAVFPNLAVNPMRDFAPVTQVVDVPSVLVVNPSFTVDSVGALVAYAKKNPGKLNYASPGSGSQNRLEMELLRKAEGLDMVHVPYKGGAGPAVTGLVAGETQVMFTTAPSAMGQIQGKRIRALAVTSAKRMAQLPQTPTMIESGYRDFVSSSWQGVFAPAGTPQAAVDKLFSALQQTLKTPAVAERLAGGGVDVALSASPKDFAAFVAAESQRWGRVARESGATVD
ncbi:MAG TPA: tripartite tricarboxylate transporter substrate binding protein [Burkholderiales bacterium]|nr:tripartite tricarboxylate transporter substrate binding protein [Burkholderiales bacterium]